MSIFHSLIWVGAQCFPKNNLIPLQNKEKRKRNKYLLTLKCNSIIESLNRNKLKKFQLKKKFASRSSLGFTGLKEQPNDKLNQFNRVLLALCIARLQGLV